MNKNKTSKLLVVQAAGLGFDFLKSHAALSMAGMDFHPLDTVFPALTCTVQASFRTASRPDQHGMPCNGIYDRRLRKPMFWEQSSAMVDGERIWETARTAGRTVGMLFWQQSLGEPVDLLLSPAPIHRHHGGMIADCYSQPVGLYQKLCRTLGRPFALRHYWGPLASARSSQWIAEATACLLDDPDLAPDLCLTYLPALDYNLQRYGTGDARSLEALVALRGQLEVLADAAGRNGYGLVVFGDYAIADCGQGAVLPNVALARAGLLKLREVKGMLYPDFHTSRAFAMVDHEIAHVVVKDATARHEAAQALGALPGIRDIMDRESQRQAGVAHANSGELVLVADDGWWLAYPWWLARGQAPDFASHVDIHNKPGYDPCELFSGWPPGSVSLDTGRIRGSHGRVGPGREAAWAATCLETGPTSLISLALSVKGLLKNG
jgi:predicted AlkP superfamily pyrophosphatase or phosphodiesterase